MGPLNESRGVNLKGQFNGHTSGNDLRYISNDDNIRIKRGPGSQLNSIHQKNGESIIASRQMLPGMTKNSTSVHALPNYQMKQNPLNSNNSLREAYSMHQMPADRSHLKRESQEMPGGGNLDLSNVQQTH